MSDNFTDLVGDEAMSKKSTMPVERRTQLVLRLLSKEESAVQIARRAGISEQTLYRWRDAFISGGSHALNGRGGLTERAKERARLAAQISERDQVIGELTIANRVLKKVSGTSS
jgi:transposase-like protein